MMQIEESGLTFGPYADEHCFHIEKSATYRRIQDCVHMAKFLLLQPRVDRSARILVDEAKSSTPRTADPVRFKQFIAEVGQKLLNGVTLGIASRLQRHQTANVELSPDFKTLDLATVEFRLILIINGHKAEWLPDLQDALNKELHSTARTWGKLAVAVLNEEGARKHHLIV